ncbi:MAG: mechanosensitive ion channel family protein [Arcicella sp.]|nr:mechanosensitive ion channel family protein [Arcicella sp.]
MQFLTSEILENKVTDILWLIIILIFGLLLRRYLSDFISKVFYRSIRHDGVSIYTCISLLRKPVNFLITLIIIYLSFSFLKFPSYWNIPPAEFFGLRMILNKTFQGLLIFAVAQIIAGLIKFIALIFQEKAKITVSKMDDQLISFFRDLSVVLIYVFAFLMVLGSVFGVNIGTFVAGLGIGGLAIALAARETLENLFASFTLFLDLPFVVGDKIQLDKVSGRVENIGFRSTRIRTEMGSLIIVPNRLITAQALENQNSRNFSGVEFILKLQTDVSVAIIQEIVAKIQQYVENHKMIYKPDTGKTHFHGFGDNSLDIIINYHIATDDAPVLKEVREEINLKIMDIVEQSKANCTVPVHRIIKDKKNQKGD